MSEQQETIKTLLWIEAAAIASLVPVALYQIDQLPALPDPPAALFDSEQIVSSKAAHPFGVPDALLGILNFGVTALLAHRSRRSLQARTLLAAKLIADGALATFNLGRQVIEYNKLCSWCTATAGFALAAGAVGRGIIIESCGALRATGHHTPHNETSRYNA